MAKTWVIDDVGNLHQISPTKSELGRRSRGVLNVTPDLIFK